jgi:hypothetical protein
MELHTKTCLTVLRQFVICKSIVRGALRCGYAISPVWEKIELNQVGRKVREIFPDPISIA